jgi:hypothetical protein
MTKDQYYEMCELLGTEPKEDEIPIEFEDLYDEIQEAIQVYNMLSDVWDGMSGTYMGKNFIGIQDIFNIMEIEDSKTCFSILNIIDKRRSKIINDKKPKASEKTKPAK